MRTALVIAAKDLRQRLRDRSALMLAFVAPVVLAVIISGAIGGQEAGFSASFALVDEDGSDISRAFSEQVLQAPQLRDAITVDEAGSVEAARRMTERGEAGAAFAIPAGFGEAVTAGAAAEITVIRSADAPFTGQVAEALARAYTDEVAAGRIAVFVAGGAAGQLPGPDRIAELSAASAERRMPVQLADGSIGTTEVTGAHYFGPAMAIFFLFFTVGFGARSLLAERQQGTMARLLASPTSSASILAGKTIPVFVLGLASMGTMFAVMAALFGVGWGDPLALWVLTLATVFSVLGVTAVVQTLARTDEQANSYGAMVAIILALLGGNFFPAYELPDVMQRMTLLTPNGWALRGYTDLAFDGAGLGAILPNIAAATAFGAVAGLIAVLRARRMVAA